MAKQLLFQIRALGALIKYLEKQRLGVELEALDVRVPVIALKIFTLLVNKDHIHVAILLFS